MVWAATAMAVAAATVSAYTAPTGATAGTKPNVVVLFVDDMGIDQVQVPPGQRKYGYTGNAGTISTPNVWRLAQEGMVFQTGRLPVRSGIGAPNNVYAPNAPGPDQGANLVLSAECIGGLPLNETTLAEALKPAGYATLMVGKWHLGVQPKFLPYSRGFDHYLGIPYSQDMGMSFWDPLGYDGSQPYQGVPIPLLNSSTVVEQPANLFTIATKYAGAATQFITEKAAAGTPFFVYQSFNHIHGPNSCGERWCGQSKRGPVGDAVEETDWMVGQIMAAIRSSPASDNTLVFFTSDNGAPQRPDGNSPLRGFKTMVWEGGYREPGIAWWPGKITAGTASDALVATYDIFPTVLALAGVQLPPVTMDGMDISPVLFANATDAHDCIMFYHFAHAATVANATNLAAVRCAQHKVYWYTSQGGPKGLPTGVQPEGQPAVFNLVEDPTESSPLKPGTPEYITAVTAAITARNAHIATIEIVPNQNALGNDPSLQICSAPNSKATFPQYPNCTLTPANWHIPICGSPNSKWCNQTSAGTCPANCPRFGPAPVPPGPPPPPPGPPAPPVPASNSVGCFLDHVGNQECDLPYNVQGHCGTSGRRVTNRMTNEYCNAACYRVNSSFTYFGTQYGEGCFCGTSYGHFGAAPKSWCNSTCEGNRNEICGGANVNSVYKIVPLP